jgi:hypothetical protein
MQSEIGMLEAGIVMLTGAYRSHGFLTRGLLIHIQVDCLGTFEPTHMDIHVDMDQ